MTSAVAAKKVPVSEERLLEWERGDSEPTLAQARKLAEAYKRPVALFFLPEPPREFDPLKAFRRLPGSSDALSSPLATQLRQASERRQVALDLATEAGAKFLPFPVQADEEERPADVAKRLRELLAISLDEQRSWRDPAVAYRQWRRGVEAASVIVFHFSDVEVAEARGASLALEPLPVIGVNSSDSPAGKTFSLFHEIGHIIQGSSQLCDPVFQSTRDKSPTEVWCNEFAGTFLVPGPALLADADGLSQADLFARAPQFARTFGVSREVILRRLLEHRRISKTSYQAWRDRHWEEDWSAPSTSKKEGPVIVPQETKALSRLGRTFVSSVIDALRNERITLSTATGLLGVKVKVIPKIEDRLGSASGDEAGVEA